MYFAGSAVLLVGLVGCTPAPTASDDVADVELFCEKLVALDQAPPPEPGGNNADELRSIADVAPDAVQSDMLTIVEYHRSTYREGDPSTDSYDVMPPDVQSAIDAVSAFGERHCGLPG